ncbi:hypothetical protein P43SY_004719 [Pythium insidiosum]|uniref:M96 mating-specific protein family n=1 Tax=Pythium insidiosum TaxID=114742 RepID=A0AAD5LAM8_PYTIN|nr:hypothetical protein P43SY_004719 [Pythium insidiosum]
MASADELFAADDALALASLLLSDDDDPASLVDGLLDGLVDDAAPQHAPQAAPAADSPSAPCPRGRAASASASAQRRSTSTSRQRQKDELAYLRAQVTELEQQLNALKHVPVSGSTAAPASAAASAWERIARNQMNAKQKAEAENIKLREMLEGQLKIARGLEKLLRKRPCGSILDDCIDSDARKRRRALSLSDDDTVFVQLETTLDDWYAQADDALRECGLAGQTADLQDARVRTDPQDDHVVFLEVLASKVFPFELERVCAATLECCRRPVIQLATGVYSMVGQSENVIRIQFDLEFPVRRSTVKVHIRGAMKRYVEKDREVYVWDSVGRMTSSLPAFSKCQLSDHGWTVLRRMPSQNGMPTTLVQSCSRSCPELFQSDSPLLGAKATAASDHIGVLTDVMMASYHKNYQALYQTTEDILMSGLLQDAAYREDCSPSPSESEQSRE